MLEKIVIGLIVTLTGTLIIYSFRVRQLYVVIPQLFSVSQLSNNGKMAEVRAYNRGRSTEEEISISIDPSLNLEIVASTDKSCRIEDASIKIPRIPPGDSYSVLLLVEAGELTKDKISTVSSKTTKGELVAAVEHVPANAGSMVLMTVLFLSAIAVPMYGVDYYYEWKKSEAEKEVSARLGALKNISAQGWSDLDGYSESKYRKLYGDDEFPFHIVGVSRKGKVVEIQIRVVNKAAAALEFSAYSESPFKDDDPEPWDDRNIFQHTINPSDSENVRLRVYFPKQRGDISVEFRASVGGEYISGFKRQIRVGV